MIKHILNGIKAYFGTIKIISQLGLWRYFGIPVLISLVTAVLIFTAAFGLSDNIGGFLSQWWTWDWGKPTVILVGDIFGGLIIIILGFILYKHIVMALSAPFMSPVSEKLEAHLLGNTYKQHRDTTFGEQLWRGIRINLRNLIREILWTIPVILIGLIPVIGLISTVLLFLIQAYYAGFGNMDYTLERHFKYAESVNFVRKHKGIAIGNGIVFMFFLFIPVIGVILVLPLSVTAATIGTVALLNAEKKLGDAQDLHGFKNLPGPKT